ncbi:MAG: glycosyltransferase family 39 protein, partial [Bacteroidia bacterium]|nr:glycosyltransferase family 39 protein [Bacteroidia bacterium]
MKSVFINIFNKAKSQWLNDIRFWIILFFVLRLYGITDPPIEMAHNWRQAFTNIVARNFLEIDSSIFYPRAIIYGNNSGVVGTEFPLLNYLIFLVSKVFGYAHWYGRLINLIVSSIGIYYFYLGVRGFVSKKLCFNATLVLICSIWLIFSRKSMPDTFSISLLMIGLYYGFLYFKNNNLSYLFIYGLFTSVGILCKIPGLFLLGVFVAPIIRNGVLKKTTIYFL